MKNLAALFLLGVAFGGAACDSKTETPKNGSTPTSSAPPAVNSDTASSNAAFAINGTVHTITLPTVDTPMPADPPPPPALASCQICHTPRYFLTQPKFSRKTWTAEVDKMKKVYGAPLSDDQVGPIVDYLVTIRGNGQ